MGHYQPQSSCGPCSWSNVVCDGMIPRCGLCTASGFECAWPRAQSRDSSVSRPASAASQHTLTSKKMTLYKGGQDPRVAPSTSDVDRLTTLLADFHLTGFKLCSWSALLPLPRRSTAPSLLRTTKRKNHPRMTNWANYYLPHLATGASDDPLSLALAAYSGLIMRKTMDAMYFYVKALGVLRDILASKPSSMSNQAFLRCWAATMLLAEYESQCANVQTAAHHIEGAAIFTSLSLNRFPVAQSQLAIKGADTNTALDSPDATTESTAATLLPRNERCLPAYLREYTLRLRTSNFLCSAPFDQWPQRLIATEDNPDNLLMDQLYETSATCYWHVMTICSDYHTIIETAPPRFEHERRALIDSFAGPLKATQEALQSYETQLQHILSKSWGVFQHCATPGRIFPHAPTFANPMLVMPWFFPHVLQLFLAPFRSQAEFDVTCRSAVGCCHVLEEMGQAVLYEHDFPDCFIAIWWKRGAERDAMQASINRHHGPVYKEMLSTVWPAIDAADDAGKPLTKDEILLLAMQTYRKSMHSILTTPKGKYLSVGSFFGQPWSRLQRRGQFQGQQRSTVSSWRARVEDWRRQLQESHSVEGIILPEGIPIEPSLKVDLAAAWFLI